MPLLLQFGLLSPSEGAVVGRTVTVSGFARVVNSSKSNLLPINIDHVQVQLGAGGPVVGAVLSGWSSQLRNCSVVHGRCLHARKCSSTSSLRRKAPPSLKPWRRNPPMTHVGEGAARCERIHRDAVSRPALGCLHREQDVAVSDWL